MRVLIATPLFPPDTADAALYVKELAKRMSARDTVTVVTYGRYPEHLEGVEIVAIDKRSSRISRLLRFGETLLKMARDMDRVILLNGPSAELPCLVSSFISPVPFVFIRADKKTREYSGLKRILDHILSTRAHAVIETIPSSRPEILPFEPYPKEKLQAYEDAWNTHLSDLKAALTHGN